MPGITFIERLQPFTLKLRAERDFAKSVPSIHTPRIPIFLSSDWSLSFSLEFHICFLCCLSSSGWFLWYLSTCKSTYSLIPAVKYGSITLDIVTSVGKSGSLKRWSTPAPSENIIFKFVKLAKIPAGGFHATAYMILSGSPVSGHILISSSGASSLR